MCDSACSLSITHICPFVIETIYTIAVTLTCVLLLRTSTSCATGRRWSTWGASTTMQRNHSHPTVQPPWSNLSGVCQVSHLSQHPPKPGPAHPPYHSTHPTTPPPLTTTRGGGKEGGASGPGDGFNQSQRSTQIDHTRDFCFK